MAYFLCTRCLCPVRISKHDKTFLWTLNAKADHVATILRYRPIYLSVVKTNSLDPYILLLCMAIWAIGVVCVIAPPTWEDLTHLALSGLVDSLNEV